MYSRTPVERSPSPTTIPLVRPYFVGRTVFSVCAVPDQWPSLKCDQRPGQMEFSPSRATISSRHNSIFPRITCGASTCIRSQRWIITMLPSDTFEVIQLIWTFFYFGDATMTFSDRRALHRYNVASPPALRHSSLSSSISRPASGITSRRSDAWIMCWTDL